MLQSNNKQWTSIMSEFHWILLHSLQLYKWTIYTTKAYTYNQLKKSNWHVRSMKISFKTENRSSIVKICKRTGTVRTVFYEESLFITKKRIRKTDNRERRGIFHRRRNSQGQKARFRPIGRDSWTCFMHVRTLNFWLNGSINAGGM